MVERINARHSLYPRVLHLHRDLYCVIAYYIQRDELPIEKSGFKYMHARGEIWIEVSAPSANTSQLSYDECIDRTLSGRPLGRCGIENPSGPAHVRCQDGMS